MLEQSRAVVVIREQITPTAEEFLFSPETAASLSSVFRRKMDVPSTELVPLGTILSSSLERTTYEQMSKSSSSRNLILRV